MVLSKIACETIEGRVAAGIKCHIRIVRPLASRTTALCMDWFSTMPNDPDVSWKEVGLFQSQNGPELQFGQLDFHTSCIWFNNERGRITTWREGFAS